MSRQIAVKYPNFFGFFTTTGAASAYVRRKDCCRRFCEIRELGLAANRADCEESDRRVKLVDEAEAFINNRDDAAAILSRGGRGSVSWEVLRVTDGGSSRSRFIKMLQSRDELLYQALRGGLIVARLRT